MICIEDYSDLIPARAGKIVGVASYRGDFLVIACEYGVYRLWDDGFGVQVAPGVESDMSLTPSAGVNDGK